RAANSLDIALNLSAPRLSPQEALTSLPEPAPDCAATPRPISAIFAASPQAPLSTNQQTMAALALAVDMAISDPSSHPALISNDQKVVEQADAANYIHQVAAKVIERRETAQT